MAWRTGHKQRRNIYWDDHYRGVMFNELDAMNAVAALNSFAPLAEPGESKKLTRSGYERLVAEDIAWLRSLPRTLERDHVILICKQSVEQEYPAPIPQGEASQAAAVRLAE